jgi:hypothetical protein
MLFIQKARVCGSTVPCQPWCYCTESVMALQAIERRARPRGQMCRVLLYTRALVSRRLTSASACRVRAESISPAVSWSGAGVAAQIRRSGVIWMSKCGG